MIREIGMVFVFAGLFSVLFKALRQPLIPAYVLAGLVLGPLGFGLITHRETIAGLSEISVVVMLFVIGVEMDLTKLARLGLVAIGGGLIQVGATFFAGFGLARLCGSSNVVALYLGIATSFSSTMLVVKILGDKKDLDSLYGKITIGILVMQDVMAIFALSLVTTIDNFSIDTVLSTFTLAAGLILIVVFICGKYLFPQLLAYVARERETLFVVVMAALFLAAFYAEHQRLSQGIGSFLVGLAIARSAYRFEIVGELKALKLFFSILFFTALGLQLAPAAALEGRWVGFAALGSTIYQYAWLILLIMLATTLLKPLFTAMAVSCLGYQRSTSFHTGMALGQLSEFSLVLIAQGIAYRHLPESLLPPVIIITVVSMTLSSYLLNYSPGIYRRVSKHLGWLDRLSFHKQQAYDLDSDANGYEVVLVGCDRLGWAITEALRQTTTTDGEGSPSRPIKFVVVDSNPDVIAKLKEKGVPCIFGDVSNHEVLEKLNVDKLRLIISTIPDPRDSELLFRFVIEHNPKANIVAVTDSRGRANQLYELGAHYVLVTYVLAARHLMHSRGMVGEGINMSVLLNPGDDLRERGRKHHETLSSDSLDQVSF
jgi:Kef-type K+ transport system membrane component KefB